MKSAEKKIMERALELCDSDEAERSFTTEVLVLALRVVVETYDTRVGRPTAQTLLAFAEAYHEAMGGPE